MVLVDDRGARAHPAGAPADPVEAVAGPAESKVWSLCSRGVPVKSVAHGSRVHEGVGWVFPCRLVLLSEVFGASCFRAS